MRLCLHAKLQVRNVHPHLSVHCSLLLSNCMYHNVDYCSSPLSPSLAIAPAVIAISCFIYLLLHLDQPVLSSQVISSDSHTCCGTGCTFMHIVNNNCLIPVWQLLHSRGSGYAGRLLGRMQLPAGVGAGKCGEVRGCINHLSSHGQHHSNTDLIAFTFKYSRAASLSFTVVELPIHIRAESSPSPPPFPP